MENVVYQPKPGYLWINNKIVPMSNIVMEITQVSGVDEVTLRSAGDGRIWMGRVPVTDIVNESDVAYDDLAAFIAFYEGADSGVSDTVVAAGETGSVVLASGRYIPSTRGVLLTKDKVTLQLLSANLSAETTFSPQYSADGTNWDVATDGSDEDIVHTFADDVPFVKTYESVAGLYWRWLCAGVTTGTVAYVVKGAEVVPDPEA